MDKRYLAPNQVPSIEKVVCPATGQWPPPVSIWITSEGPSQFPSSSGIHSSPSQTLAPHRFCFQSMPQYTLTGKPGNLRFSAHSGLLSKDPGVRRMV